MRFAKLATAVLASALFVPTAQAGGVGLLFTGGTHSEMLFYYSNQDAGGNNYTDWRDYDQYQLTEYLGHGGGGIELILGDRDDKITGVFRGFYQYDTAQINPADVQTAIPADAVEAPYRDEGRHIGVGMVGVNFGFLGDPQNFLLGATTHLGSGFLTSDHTEFFTGDAGITASYRIARPLQVFADVVYTIRWRKELSHGANGYLGIRYLFD